VRPGITGLWQICRHDRHKGDFHQWIYYDLLYIRTMSLWLDVKIAALTIVSFARGGYIPLSWLLPPEKYGERRSKARQAESTVELTSNAQPDETAPASAPTGPAGGSDSPRG
jgi:glycine/D-amino acid oxidase-like deaminating enzyme